MFAGNTLIGNGFTNMLISDPFTYIRCSLYPRVCINQIDIQFCISQTESIQRYAYMLLQSYAICESLILLLRGHAQPVVST